MSKSTVEKCPINNLIKNLKGRKEKKIFQKLNVKDTKNIAGKLVEAL